MPEPLLKKKGWPLGLLHSAGTFSSPTVGSLSRVSLQRYYRAALLSQATDCATQRLLPLASGGF
jgi:hypothetical protein